MLTPAWTVKERETRRCTVARPTPVPSEVGGRVQALEHAKELVGVRHVQTGAVVANEVDDPAWPFVDAEFNSSLGSLARELPGIAEQILESNLQQTRIAFGTYPVRNGEFHLPTGCRRQGCNFLPCRVL